jgi:hypothetical protein
MVKTFELFEMYLRKRLYQPEGLRILKKLHVEGGPDKKELQGRLSE